MLKSKQTSLVSGLSDWLNEVIYDWTTKIAHKHKHKNKVQHLPPTNKHPFPTTCHTDMSPKLQYPTNKAKIKPHTNTSAYRTNHTFPHPVLPLAALSHTCPCLPVFQDRTWRPALPLSSSKLSDGLFSSYLTTTLSVALTASLSDFSLAFCIFVCFIKTRI